MLFGNVNILMKELNEKLKNVNYSNINDKDNTVDYFDPGDKGENNVTWLKLKITAEYVDRNKKTKKNSLQGWPKGQPFPRRHTFRLKKRGF